MSCLYIIDQNALSIGGHYFSYTSCIATAALEAGYEVVLLENTRKKSDWNIKGARVIPAFSSTWGETEARGVVPWGPGNIAYEYATAVAASPPRAEDHVLLLTVGFVELKMLLDYVIKLPPSLPTPSFHIMLRYSPEEILWRFKDFDEYFSHISESPRLSRLLHFYTDTDRLSADYSALTRVPFHTLPIPFQQDVLRRHMGKPHRDDGILRVAYLGDARLEKNFHWIPEAVDAVLREPRLAGRVQFTLQCHFNVEGGEEHQLAAKQRLAQFPSSVVMLIDRPLNNEDYYGLLTEADVVLIPYSPVNYRARSSGVLVEAMAAGKAVITTRGSWMESMMTVEGGAVFDGPDSFGAALVDLLLDIQARAAAARVEANRMLDWSSGANFIRAFGEHAPRTTISAPVRPHIFVVMNGDAMVLRNGASCVARAQFAYLRAANYKVTALFLTYDRSGDAQPVERYAEQLRDAVIDLDLDGWFIAAPGRLSLDTLGQRSARSWRSESIISDYDRSCRYDFPAEIMPHLRRERPDVVLLNYITNFGVLETLGLDDIPVICEMHDIQSFQKGIYGRRAVASADLDLEFSLLQRCNYLISLNASETSFVRERLPDTPIATTGVFSLEKPPSLAALAGCKDLAEVVSSSQPDRVEFDFDSAWNTGKTSEIYRLFKIKFIDIFYVSSNHLANVTGLRWFIDNVYIPVLSPLGVTMVVAGSIADVAGWPNAERLFFVGRVQNLAPLYAAARVVILPITEGAGAPVKSFEAMRFGRPIVTTSLGVRGLSAVPEGIEVANDPEDFADAILRLLESADLRASRGAQISQSTRAFVNPERYRSIMDGVFRTVLDGRAQTSKPIVETSEVAAYSEWGREVQIVNRLMRDLLSGEPFDYNDIISAREIKPEELETIAKAVVQALYIDHNAPILKSQRNVLELVRKAPSKDISWCEQGARLLQALITEPASLAGLNRPEGRSISLCFFIRTDWEGRLTVLTTSRSMLSLDGDEATTLSENGVNHGRRAFMRDIPVMAAVPFRFRHLTATATLDVPDPGLVFVLRQKVNVDDLAVEMPDASRQGGANRRMVLQTGVPLTFSIPNIASSHEQELFVDLEFRGDLTRAEVIVMIGDNPVPAELTVLTSSTRLRVQAPSNERRVPFKSLPLTVKLVGTPLDRTALILAGISLSLVIGGEPRVALSGVDIADAMQASPGDLARHSLRSLSIVTREMAAGMPIEAGTVDLLRSYTSAQPKWLESALSGLISSRDDMQAHKVGAAYAALSSLLSLQRTTAVSHDEARSFELIASPALPVAIHATFAPGTRAEQLRGRLGGDPATCIEAENEHGVWMRPGKTVFDLGDWLTLVSFIDEAGHTITPISCTAWISLTGVANADGKRTGIKTVSLYEPESIGGVISHSWTGPDKSSMFVVPIMPRHGIELHLEVINFGRNTNDDDISISVNGLIGDIEVERFGEGGWITCAIPPTDVPSPSAYCVLTTHQQMTPGAEDTRKLGIAVGKVEVKWALSASSQATLP